MAAATGLVSFGFSGGSFVAQPPAFRKRQLFVELAVEFIDEQVKGTFHGDRYAFVAPAALTVFVWVFMMNVMISCPSI